jgi:GrpB-like predicted nucleotidyltransferase (UPF0157 family)
VDYDLGYTQRFQFLCKGIAEVLGNMAAAVEHIESTAASGGLPPFSAYK